MVSELTFESELCNGYFPSYRSIGIKGTRKFSHTKIARIK
jgi:hypothetical protein